MLNYLLSFRSKNQINNKIGVSILRKYDLSINKDGTINILTPIVED